MSNDFPKMVYACPGPEVIEGIGYKTLIVHDEAQLAQALSDGFHITTTAAAEAEGKEDGPALKDEADALMAQLEDGLARLNAEKEQLAKDQVALADAQAQLALDREAFEEDKLTLATERTAFESAMQKSGKK